MLVLAVFFWCCVIVLHVPHLTGELQSILCVRCAPDDITYTGTLSGDLYKWKGHTLQSVIKGAHNVSLCISLLIQIVT